LQKKALKEEMREEILKELRNAGMDEKKNKLKKKYPKAIPSINEESFEKIQAKFLTRRAPFFPKF
jgi:hypothetical protein